MKEKAASQIWPYKQTTTDIAIKENEKENPIYKDSSESSVCLPDRMLIK